MGIQSGYLEDRERVVLTALNEVTLRATAEATGGRYYPFTQRMELFRVLERTVRERERASVAAVLKAPN